MERWFKVSHRDFDECLASLSGNACKIYLKLARHANQDGLAWPSYSSMQRSLGLSRGTISKALNELKGAGLISVEDRQYRIGSKNGLGSVETESSRSSSKNRPSSSNSGLDSSDSRLSSSKNRLDEIEELCSREDKSSSKNEPGEPSSSELGSLKNRLDSLENGISDISSSIFRLVEKMEKIEAVQKMNQGSSKNELQPVQKIDSNKKHGTRHKEQEEEVLSALPTPFEQVGKSKVEPKKLEVAKRLVRAEKESSRKTIEDMSYEEIEACLNGKIEFEKEWSIEKLWEGEEKAVEVEVVGEEEGYEKLFSRERRNEQQRRIEAVTNLLCVDEKLYSAARIAREIVPLVSLGAKAEDFETWLRWWKEYDFRGRQGERPANIKVVIHFWRQAMEWKKNGCKKATKVGYEKKGLTERIKESWEELERSMSL